MTALAAFTFLRPLALLALLPLAGLWLLLRRRTSAEAPAVAAHRPAPARRAHHRPRRPHAASAPPTC